MHPRSRGELEGKLAGECFKRSAHKLYVLLKKPRSPTTGSAELAEALRFCARSLCLWEGASSKGQGCPLNSEPFTAGELLTLSAPVTPLLSLWHCHHTRHFLMAAGKPVTGGALGDEQCKVRPEGNEVAARVNIPVNFYTLMANGSLKFNSSSNQ